MSEQRPAAEGELCTCGRQAVTVYPTHDYGDVGHCGVDGAGQNPVVPCPWCGAIRPHTTWGVPVRCPDYRLRPPAPEAPGEHGSGSAAD